MRFVRAIVIVASIAAFFGGPALAEVDLDAPAVKKITVQTEIIRGRNVVNDCVARNGTSPTSVIYRCLDVAQHSENRNNTDTDAFMLGFYAAAVKELDLPAQDADRKQQNARLVQFMKDLARQADAKQKLVGASDAQIAKLISMPALDWRAALNLWLAK